MLFIKSILIVPEKYRKTIMYLNHCIVCVIFNNLLSRLFKQLIERDFQGVYQFILQKYKIKCNSIDIHNLCYRTPIGLNNIRGPCLKPCRICYALVMVGSLLSR